MKIIEDPNNRAVYLKVGAITKDTRRGIRQAYYKIGKDLKAYAAKKIKEGPKTGIKYVIYGGFKTHVFFDNTKRTKKIHQASAPGEFPARLSGGLIRSLGFAVSGWTQLEFGADAPYAKALEEGDDRVKARPYLKPSLKATEGSAVTHFETEIKKALTKNG